MTPTSPFRRAGSSGRARTTRGRPALVGAVVSAVVLAGACSSDPAEPPPTTAPTVCVAPRGADLVDVDLEALPEKPWRHPAGTQVRVVFETSGLSPRYRQMVVRGARTWSASPCVDAVTADRCAPGDNCVAVVHEMGHALGLRHRTDPRSVMYPTSDESSDAAPDPVDLANLVTLYG